MDEKGETTGKRQGRRSGFAVWQIRFFVGLFDSIIPDSFFVHRLA